MRVVWLQDGLRGSVRVWCWRQKDRHLKRGNIGKRRLGALRLVAEVGGCSWRRTRTWLPWFNVSTVGLGTSHPGDEVRGKLLCVAPVNTFSGSRAETRSHPSGNASILPAHRACVSSMRIGAQKNTTRRRYGPAAANRPPNQLSVDRTLKTWYPTSNQHEDGLVGPFDRLPD